MATSARGAGPSTSSREDPTERSEHMRNEVIFDSRGIPDIMVVFTPDELGFPAEIRGKAVKEYAISKYPNTLFGGAGSAKARGPAGTL